MITIVLMMHTLTWMNFQSLEYLYPGESTYICDAKFSQPGPKDSIIRAWCEYEPWMERWIDPGEGPDVETVSRMVPGLFPPTVTTSESFLGK